MTNPSASSDGSFTCDDSVIRIARSLGHEVREASLVLTRYGSDDDAWGVLGVLGPTRLPYWRAVPMVRFMAELMDVVNSRPGL